MIDKEAAFIDVIVATNSIINSNITTVKQVIAQAADIFDVSADEIKSKAQRHPVIMARHTVICAVKTIWPDCSLNFIGGKLNRDHCTIWYTLKKYNIKTERGLFGYKAKGRVNPKLAGKAVTTTSKGASDAE